MNEREKLIHEAQIKALEESIEHWKDIVTTVSPYSASVFDVNISGGACACCRVFMLYNEELDTSNCSHCPVAIQTLRRGCLGSPWERVLNHRSYRRKAEFLDAARDELAFLIDVLDKTREGVFVGKKLNNGHVEDDEDE